MGKSLEILHQELSIHNSVTMLQSVVGLALLSVVYSQQVEFGGCPTVDTQKSVNITEYLGTWYEIYAFPTHWEQGKCTRAVYSLKDNGHINVFNRGIQDGKVNAITGECYRPHDSEQGKLLVRFSNFQPWGNYWIVHTNYKDFTLIYSCTSAVGLAHFEQAWILARNMTVSQEMTDKLMQELASYKVDVSKFKKTDQTGCPP